jgi:hypothetical protein
MISLLIAASALLSADAPANLEAQLVAHAATQEKTYSAYARLSYDATRTISGFNQHLGRELTDVARYEVRSRSNTILVTCTTTWPETGKPFVQKVLLTPDYAAYWGLAELPQVSVQFRADWSEEEDKNGYTEIFYSVAGPLIQEECFGHSKPLFESLKRKVHDPKWSITSSDSTAEVIVQRALRNREAVYTTDLTYWIDPHDGLVRRTEFSANGESNLRAVQYLEFKGGMGTMRVPQRVQSPADDAKAPKSGLKTTIEYADFVDESDLPPLTLADMGIPPKGEVLRHWPVEGKPSQALPWDGRDLIFRPSRNRQRREINP